MARPFFSTIAALARAPASADERRARQAALREAYEAEKAALDKPCATPLAPFKVAVVGAGLAGLSTALALARLGMQVRVYEARNAVGGRVLSNSTAVPGRIVEKGAELIGAIHPMCLEIAKLHGIGLVTRTDDEAAHQMQLASRVLIDGAFLGQQELLDLARQLDRKLLMPIARHARIVRNPAQPWAQPTLQPWDKVDVAAVARRLLTPGSKLWKLLEILLVNDQVAPLAEQNYLALLCLVRAGHSGTRDRQLMGYWDDLENFRCANGNEAIARAMKTDLLRAPQAAVQTNSAVTAIDLDGTPRVTWNRTDSQGNILPGSQTEPFDFVVLATPPSVWRHTTIRPASLGFPAKPGVMNMGQAIKFFAPFDRRFWIKRGFAALGGADGLGQVWESTDNQTLLPEQKVVLAAFAGGRTLPSDKSITDNMEKLYPGFTALSRPQFWARWPQEPFIECGYAAPLKDQVFGVGRALNAPFAGRLCFAGEHTSLAYFGYMEGALRSGLRAARQIVGLACGSKPMAAPAPRVRVAELEAGSGAAQPEGGDRIVEVEVEGEAGIEAEAGFDGDIESFAGFEALAAAEADDEADTGVEHEADHERDPDSAFEFESVPDEREVIGSVDSRQRVTDTLPTPYRWICAIDLRVDDPLRGKGAPPITLASRATGILIGPRHVLTAAHVFAPKTITVEGRERAVPVTSVVVSPARNGDNESHPFGSAVSRVWRVSTAARHPDDYALVILERDIAQNTNRKATGPLGWWTLRRLDPATLGQPAIEVSGYPGDRCGDDAATGSPSAKEAQIRAWVNTRRREWASTLWRAGGKARLAPRLSIIAHDADTYEGESGGPICVRSGGALEVLGVHTGSVTPADGGPAVLNRGVRVTRRMLAELCRWINAHAERAAAEVRNDTLLFASAPPATKESAFENEPATALAGELDPGGEHDLPDSPSALEAEPPAALEADTPAGPSAADRATLRAAAKKITAGLSAASATLPRAPAGTTRGLVEFIVSLLRTHFFPSGHGEVGSDRRVITYSRRARIGMTLENDDGVRTPFWHTVLLTLHAHRPERKWVGGDAGGEISSVVRIFVADFAKVDNAQAATITVHETVHVLFRLMVRLRERHGDAMFDRLLAREPWRRFDERPLATLRRELALRVETLRKLLPMQVTADELAGSLVQEAFAYTLGQWFEAMVRLGAPGPKVVVESSSIAPILVKHYVLELAPSFTGSLTQPEVVRAVKELAPAIEAVGDALRARWGSVSPPPVRSREVMAAPG